MLYCAGAVLADFEAPPEGPPGDNGNGGDGEAPNHSGPRPSHQTPEWFLLPKLDLEGPMVDNPNPVFGDTICFSFQVVSADDGLDYVPPYLAFCRLLPNETFEILAGEPSYIPFVLGDDGVWRVCVNTSIFQIPGVYRAYLVVRRPANDCSPQNILVINLQG
ncbi:hypothetical protein KJ616_02155 [Patescibacteria group bacterium]|nr:hypothetical protein [Patescibacteria group bacterium]